MRHFYNALLRVKQTITTLFSNAKSLTLNGTNQYMSVADDDSLSFTNGAGTDEAFSVSFKLKTDSFSQTGGILVKNTHPTSYEWGVYLSTNLFFTLYSAGGVSAYLSARYIPTGLEANRWYDFTFTYDGSEAFSGITLYIDGVPTALTNTGVGSYAGMSNTSNALNVGFYDGLGWYLDGSLDKIAIWNKELSLAEVKEAVVIADLTQHSAYANIVSWWEFDDDDVSGTTVSDRVGSNDGTMVNTPTRSTDIPFPYSYQLNSQTSFSNVTPFTDGSTTTLSKYGGFMWDLDGSAEYIQIPDADVFSFGNGSTDSPFTLSCWMSMDANNTAGLVSKWGSNQEWLFRTDGREVRFYIHDASAGASPNIVTTDSPLLYAEGKFHLVITYDGTGGSSAIDGAEIYINGVLQTAVTRTNSGSYVAMENNTDPVYIGYQENVAGNYFDGRIGDVCILDKELSAAEVLAMYNNHEPRDETKTSLSANVVGYWRAYNSTNVSSGVLDLSGNGNHGTPTNMEDADFTYKYPRESYPLTTGTSGSFLFGGTNETCNFGNDSTLSFGNGTTDSPFSLSAWIAPTNYGGFRVFGKYGTNDEYGLWFTVGGAPTFRLIDDSSGGYIGRIGAATSNLAFRWAHIVATYDGSGSASGMKIYVNGARVDTTNQNSGTYTAMEDTAENLYVAYIPQFSTYSVGQFHGAAIFDVELTAGQARELYNNGSPINLLTDFTGAGDCIHYWEFGQGDSPTGTVYDQVGSSDGTPANMESGDLYDETDFGLTIGIPFN